MVKTKLTYFSAKALAEPIRFLLSYLGEEFDDIRFKREDWPSIKPETPFGKVPMLEMDGKVHHQSTAICRYLGKKAGLSGNNDLENLQIDIAVDTLHDFRQEIAKFFYERDENLKNKKKEILLNEIVPFFLPRYDQLIKDNGGYVANGKLSWGDIYFIALYDYLNFTLGMNFAENYPNIKKLKDEVLSLPKIKEWVAKRPKTDL